MGLDTVELVMDIEEAFDISIPDDKASRMLTVGDVYEFVLEKTANTIVSPGKCLSAAAFYELRRHMQSLGLPTLKLRPSSTIDAIIPCRGRNSHWRALASSMDVRFPQLDRPLWLALLIWLSIGSLMYCVFLFFTPYVVLGMASSLLTGMATAICLLWLTKPCAIYLPSSCTTVRDLVTNLIAINYSKLATRYSTRNPTDIWNALQLIVAEQLGVDRSKVVPTARFVEDLGAD